MSRQESESKTAEQPTPCDESHPDLVTVLMSSEARITERIDRMDTRINGRIRSLETFRAGVEQRHAVEDARGKAVSTWGERIRVAIITSTAVAGAFLAFMAFARPA